MADITKGTQGHTGRIRQGQGVPEYQGKAVTQPAQPVQGYQAAFETIGKASEMMAELGGQIASNAAQQQAQLSGIEAGQVPGQTLFPEFTQAGKAYNDAYRDQSYKVLSTEGQNYIDKLSFELAKNPNPSAKDLESFENNAKKGIDGLMQHADPSYKQDLKRALSNKYNSDFQALSGKLAIYNQKVLKQQDAMASETNSSNIYAYTVRGMPEAAEAAYEDELKNIETSNDTEPEKLARLKALDYQKKYAEQVKEGTDAAEAGDEDAIKWLKEFKDNKPENITEAQHEQMIPELYKHYAQQRAYKAYDSQIARATANDLILSGQMTVSKLQELQPEMTLSDFIQVQKQFMKTQDRELKGIQASDFISSNKDNPGALANVSNKDLDSGFSRLLARESENKKGPVNYLDEARLAQGIQATIPSFNKKTSAMINGLDPNQAAVASQVYGSLSSSNPSSVAGVDSKSAAKASMISGLMKTGTPADAAVGYVNNKLNGLTENGVKELKDSYTVEARTRAVNDPIKMISYAAKSSGFNEGLVPPGFGTDFSRALEKYYVLTMGDFEQATELASNEIKTNYVETDFNGYKEVMYLAPSLTYGGDEGFIKKKRFENSSELFEKIDSQFKDTESNALYGYKFFGSGPNQIHNSIIREDKSGKKEKGYLIIKNDNYTQKPGNGQSPSYSMWFMNEGRTKLNQITDPETGGIARFEITPKQLEEKERADVQEADLEAEKIRYYRDINNKINDLRLQGRITNL